MSDPIDDKIISDVIAQEGGFENDPADPNGRTFEGISEKSNPAAWASGQPTDAQVRAIYEQKYIQGPGFDKVQDPKLRGQLVDWAVNSGPGVAIQNLQQILGLKQDGVLGPETLKLVNAADPRLLGNHVVAARVLMLGRVVVRNPGQLKFLSGWLSRALSFLG